MSDREVWLIRHAESAWNALGRWQGQADPPLSERGREQAAALAASLARERFALLASSDLMRARETAAALGRALGMAPRFDARLRERDVGIWAGRTRSEIEARWPAELDLVQSRDLSVRPGGGESMDDTARRVRPFFCELAVAHRGGPIAIVAHGGVIRALCHQVGPLANAHFVRVSLAALVEGG